MAEFREARQANDTAKLDALRPKVDSARAEMTKLRGAHEEKIAATFNDDQKAQWNKIKEEREARMKERAASVDHHRHDPRSALLTARHPECVASRRHAFQPQH
jgi:hypothetical protein